MNIETILGLIFAGISAICAIIGVKSKETVNSVKEDIERYKNHIMNKNYLTKLEPKIDILKKQSSTFVKISIGKLPQQGMKKTELDYYKDIKTTLNEILNEIPSNYDGERKLIREINESLGYCIKLNTTFRELDRNDIYGYSIVEDKFSQVIAQLDTAIMDLRC